MPKTDGDKEHSSSYPGSGVACRENQKPLNLQVEVSRPPQNEGSRNGFAVATAATAVASVVKQGLLPPPRHSTTAISRQRRDQHPAYSVPFDGWIRELDGLLEEFCTRGRDGEREAIVAIRKDHPHISSATIWARMVYLGLTKSKRPPYSRHDWSPEDLELLRYGYSNGRNGASRAIDALLERHPGWSRSVVSWKAKSLGLSRKRAEYQPWSEDVDRQLISCEGFQLESVEKRMKRSKGSIWSRLLALDRGAEFALHTIEDRSVTLDGPAGAGEWAIPKPLGAGESLLTVTAVRANADPIDVKPKDGSTRVSWMKPDGRWQIVWSVVHVHAPEAGWTMKNMIDVMNPAATAEFLRLTHDETFRRFGPDFGKTIKGFFSDETGFRNVTSYQSLPGTPGMPMPWSLVLPDIFRQWKSYDLAPWLPALWYDLGPRSRQVRQDFVDVCSRAFAEHFFKPQQDWCHAHGVRLIGHLVEDNHADHNLGYGPGHWFRSMRYFDMPGIDIVGYQVTPGVDAGEVPWTIGSGSAWDQEHFQFGLPAMARGAALIQGTREIMSEAFGAYGWSLGLRDQKWVGDWHIVNGIGVLSPHAFTMKHHDPDCPQHFNRTSGNPQWRYYRQWAQQFGRMQQVLAATDAVYDAAVLYTAESAWVGPAQNVAPAVRTLETNQISTVVLPYESLVHNLEIHDGAWWISGRALRSVVLPYARFLPGFAAERLVDLANAGVRVIVLESWPEASADARSDQMVRSAVARLKASSNAVLTTTQEAPAHVQTRNIEAASCVPMLIAALRSGKEGRWLLLHNRSVIAPVSTRLLIRNAPAHAALLDAATGQYLSIPYQRTGRGLHIDLQIPVYSLWAIRLSASVPPTGRMPIFHSSQPVSTKWEASRAVDDSDDRFERIGVRTQLDDWRRWPGMDSYAGTVRYRATVDLKDIRGAVGFDAGRVEEIAELYVNGRHVGVRFYPPYLWDVSSAVRAGGNEIIIDVTNTAFARWKDSFSHGDAASGLFGPIRIVRG